MHSNLSVFSRLSANYTFIFIYLGIISPFWAIWLQSNGLSPSEIGIIIAVPHILKIIIAPMISQEADKRQEYRRPLLLCVITSIFFSSFYFLAQNFWHLLFITVAVNMTWPAIMPLLETITVGQVERNNLNYGRIRTFGSISFICAAVLLGYFLKNNSPIYILWFLYGCLVLLFIAASFLPSGNRKAEETFRSVEKPIKDLLFDRQFIWFLLVIGLIQMSHGLFYSLGSIYWRMGGITEDIIGLLWGIGVVAEIAVFMVFGDIIKKKPLALICLIAGLLGTFRWVVTASTFSLPILILIQITHGMTFGATHLAAINYLGNKVKSDYAGTAQSLYTALPLGLGMACSTYFGSLIYENSPSSAYLTMALLCLTATILSILAIRRSV